MAACARIVIPYAPRRQFVAYHETDRRFCASVAHRRAGKTVARINKLIRKAVECKLHRPRFGYLAPYLVQAKEIAWVYLQDFAKPLTDLGGKVNESELSVTLPHNKAIIRLYGAENAQRMRGLYFDGLVVDEAQGIPKSTLTTILLPCLADRQGWLDCSGTPKGWGNLLGALVKLARTNPREWFLQILRASETGILPESELALQRGLLDDNEYAQEYECDFDAAITGAIYGKQMSAAEREGRIGSVEPEPGVPVHTAWDLGYDDATAIWWWQVIAGRELRILAYYENSCEEIAHYCDILDEKRQELNIRYGKHFVPHDAKNKLLAAGGRSIVQQAYDLGVKMTAVPATSQQNSIEALRKTLKSCWFDAQRCDDGLDALRQYQFEFDEDKKVYRSKPRHDWASHGSDAMEIIGQVWRKPIKEDPAPPPRFFPNVQANELFKVDQPKSYYEQRV